MRPVGGGQVRFLNGEVLHCGNTNSERESGSTISLEDYRAKESHTAPFEVRQTFLSVNLCIGTSRNACPTIYAVNEVPQPQLPVAFGFVNVKPEPITLVT